MSSLPPASLLTRRRWTQWLAGSLLATSTTGLYAATFERLDWEALVPPDWDPMASFSHFQDLADVPDTDPRVQQLYEQMRQVWDAAPTVAELEGRNIRIPGFVVPLEGDRHGMSEFLLVPYFGACIHTPPPPANQIIHVTTHKPVRGFESMSAVWVSGQLRLARKDSEMGASGYLLQAQRVQAYQE